MENYEVIKTIGRGSYGTVHLAVHRATGKQVALKVFKKAEIKNERVQKRLDREIEIMKKLSTTEHENIVKYYESFVTEKETVIAMEYIEGGELFEHIWKKDGLNEEEAKQIFYQIASAVAHCHKNGIAHRDLKLENILLDAEGHPKLVDFGFSKKSHITYQQATFCGSPLYAAPEMIFARPYKGPECDIWSMGVILYTMLTACMPFDDSNISLFCQYIELSDYPEPEEVSSSCKHLIAMMLDSNNRTRATITEVMNHPWVKSAKPVTPVKTEPPKPKTRRTGICKSKSAAEAIATTLIAASAAQCECVCHLKKLPVGRDSAFVEHCEDCGSLSPIPTLKNAGGAREKKGHLSTSSSGYISTDSLCRTPSPTKEVRVLAASN